MRRTLLTASLLVLGSPAFAALDTTTGSAIDLAPVLNPLIQLMGMILVAVIPVLILGVVNWVRGKLSMQKLENTAAVTAHIDDQVQKIIGGAITRANLQPGQAILDVKNQIIADAGTRIVSALGSELTKVGTGDLAHRAATIVENRLGMMMAAQAGTPIPGPTATPLPAATAVPVALTAPVVAVDPAAKPVA